MRGGSIGADVVLRCRDLGDLMAEETCGEYSQGLALLVFREEGDEAVACLRVVVVLKVVGCRRVRSLSKGSEEACGLIVWIRRASWTLALQGIIFCYTRACEIRAPISGFPIWERRLHLNYPYEVVKVGETKGHV